MILNRAAVQKTILFGFPLELLSEALFRSLAFESVKSAPVCLLEMKTAAMFENFVNLNCININLVKSVFNNKYVVYGTFLNLYVPRSYFKSHWR